MRFAFICTEKLPSPAVRGGAIQTMLDGILPFLQRNHEITIFSITDPKLLDYEKNGSLTYYRFPRENYVHAVTSKLGELSFDVIHVFNRPKDVSQYKGVAPNSSFVLSLHNDMFSNLKLKQDEGIKAIESVEAITTVSEYIKQTVIKRYPQASSKIKVVYSGVDLEKFHPRWSTEGNKIREKLLTHYKLKNKRVVLFVGRLSKAKGPHLLIQAIRELTVKYPNIVLVIVGGKWFSENGMNEYVQSLYDLAGPLKNHILFTQYIPTDQIPATLLIGDVFVCSSQWNEPLARVHYEAMAAGLPIITTNRGGNPEVIDHGDNGLILEQYNEIAAFSKSIDHLFSDPALSFSMGKSGRKVVETNHQFYHVAKRLEQTYLDVLKP